MTLGIVCVICALGPLPPAGSCAYLHAAFSGRGNTCFYNAKVLAGTSLTDYRGRWETTHQIVSSEIFLFSLHMVQEKSVFGQKLLAAP